MVAHLLNIVRALPPTANAANAQMIGQIFSRRVIGCRRNQRSGVIGIPDRVW